MKKLTIPIHSVVDVITNSSTVIYTQASSGAKEIAIEIIDEILELAGSDKRTVDLFNISVIPMFEDMDYFWDLEDEELKDCGIDFPAFPVYEDYPEYKDYRSVRDAYEKENANLIQKYAEKTGPSDEPYDGDNGIKLTLIIKAKDGKNIKLAEKALRLFSIDAWRDG